MNTRKASDWAIARAFWSLMSNSNSGNTVTLLDIASVAEGFDAGVTCVKRNGGIKIDASKSQVETFVNTPCDKAIAQAVEFYADVLGGVPISYIYNKAREIDAAEPQADDCRGYAHLGIGAYLINHSAAGEPAELCISIATEEEKVGRVVSDSRDNSPGSLIQPETMAVRLRFENAAGLDALEHQLRLLREVHFPTTPAERAEDSDVLAIPRWRCTGYSAETQCAFVVVDENGAWMHEEDVTPLMEEYRRLAAEQNKDRKDAERWRHARHHAMEQLLTAYPTPDTSDVGLDCAVDAAMAQEAGNG